MRCRAIERSPPVPDVAAGCGYCLSNFASSITRRHLAMSEATSWRNSSGVLPRAVTPAASSRRFTSGAASAAAIAWCKRSTIARGVRAGAATAFHDDAW